MVKLYFRYGSMGSSKSAQALITRFNYEERGMNAWLIKPAIETRDGETLIRSRVGLEKEATPIGTEDDIFEMMADRPDTDVIIADESQFFTAAQVDQLRRIVDEKEIPVLCFGLRTDFRTHLFTGSQRLFELADSISEIKTICSCGEKAIVNARIDGEGYILTEGQKIMMGGNESYIALCHRCWQKGISEHKKIL